MGWGGVEVGWSRSGVAVSYLNVVVLFNQHSLS